MKAPAGGPGCWDTHLQPRDTASAFLCWGGGTSGRLCSQIRVLLVVGKGTAVAVNLEVRAFLSVPRAALTAINPQPLSLRLCPK